MYIHVHVVYCVIIISYFWQITRVFYGSPVNIQLVPNGSTVAVNRSNKSKYVQCYVDYELIEGTKKQFDAFYSGFKKVFNTECMIYVSYYYCVMIRGEGSMEREGERGI